MSVALATTPLTLPKRLKVSPEQFAQLVAANPELRLERTAQGELIVMPGTGGETGRRNSYLTYWLYAWNLQTRLGEVFDSSTAFQLPNGAIRSPDAAWVRRDRWQTLSPQQRDGFVPLCPDFAIELRSKSDRLKTLQTKMQEFITCGLSLGWLIDPRNRRIWCYEPGQQPRAIDAPTAIAADPVLPGFVLDCLPLWN